MLSVAVINLPFNMSSQTTAHRELIEDDKELKNTAHKELIEERQRAGKYSTQRVNRGR